MVIKMNKKIIYTLATIFLLFSCQSLQVSPYEKQVLTQSLEQDSKKIIENIKVSSQNKNKDSFKSSFSNSFVADALYDFLININTDAYTLACGNYDIKTKTSASGMCIINLDTYTNYFLVKFRYSGDWKISKIEIIE